MGFLSSVLDWRRTIVGISAIASILAPTLHMAHSTQFSPAAAPRTLGLRAFGGTAPNATYWDLYNRPDAPPVNNFVPSQVTEGNGAITLKATARHGAGMCWCKDQPNTPYGRWEIRARSTGVNGQEAALILWPKADWPEAGEIDISEVSGDPHDNSTTTLHYGRQNHITQVGHQSDYAKWHTFAVDWEPGSLRTWVDGRLEFSTTDTSQIPSGPMFLAIQDQPNGRWQNSPTTQSSELQVAWVKVFKAAA
jgi:hypothetical protein